MGKIPDSLPGQNDVSWVPVDIMAQIMFELVFSDFSSTAGPWLKVHNLVNPRPSSWAKLIPTITAQVNSKLSTVTFEEWLRSLQDSAKRTNAQNASQNPAVKLLEFYEETAKAGVESRLDSADSQKASETLKNLEAVGPPWMETWLTQWNFLN